MRSGWNGPYTIAPIPWSPGNYAILPVGLVNLWQSAGSISDSASSLSAWATSRAEDGESAGMRHSRGRADTLTAQAVHLASYPTAQASDSERGPDYAAKDRAVGPALAATAQMAAWSTASARDWKDTEGMGSHRTNPDGTPGRARDDQLPRQASLASWATADAGVFNLATDPEANDERLGAMKERLGNGNGAGLTIQQQAHLANWGTPMTRDTFPAHTDEYYQRQRDKGHGMQNLTDHASLAGWATANTCDATRGSPETPEQQKARGANVGMSLIDQVALIGPARLTDDGRLLIGSCAGMESGGQLDPEHSRLLMRLPDGWESCAPTETASTLKRRRSSAAPSLK